MTIITNKVFKINIFPQKSIKYKINWTANPVFFISETAAKSNWYLNQNCQYQYIDTLTEWALGIFLASHVPSPTETKIIPHI